MRRFDGEHKQLFDIMSQIHDAMRQGKGKDVLASALQKLIRYTEQHFTGEELIMSQNDYPELSSQIAQHRQFTTKIKDFEAQYCSGTVALSMQLLDYLRDWLTSHIAGADKRYSAFLNAKGVR